MPGVLPLSEANLLLQLMVWAQESDVFCKAARWLLTFLSQIRPAYTVQRSHDTSSEYLRELIRKNKDRLHLRSLLVAGAASAPTAMADAAYFDGLRERVRKANAVGAQD